MGEFSTAGPKGMREVRPLSLSLCVSLCLCLCLCVSHMHLLARTSVWNDRGDVLGHLKRSVCPTSHKSRFITTQLPPTPWFPNIFENPFYIQNSCRPLPATSIHIPDNACIFSIHELRKHVITKSYHEYSCDNHRHQHTGGLWRLRHCLLSPDTQPTGLRDQHNAVPRSVAHG